MNEDSYRLYLKKDWKGLDSLSVKLGDEFDFYYLNIRFGIAHYQLENYFKAIEYFEKAIKNNDQEELPKLYLFWLHKSLGNDGQTKYFFDQLSDETKSQQNHSHPFIENIGLSAITKGSNEEVLYGPLNGFSLGITNRFGDRIKTENQFTRLSQNLWWGNYDQYEFYTKSSIAINKRISILPYFNYIKLSGEVDYDYELTEGITTTGSSIGSYNYSASLFGLAFRYNSHRTTVLPSFQFYHHSFTQNTTINQTANAINSTFTHDDSGSDFGLQSSLKLEYILPYQQDRLKFTLDPTWVFNNEEHQYNIGSGLAISWNSNWWSSANYSFGNAKHFSENLGTTVYNNDDILNNKFQLLTGYNRGNWGFTLGYSQEKRTRSYDNTIYNYQSLNFGINYKL